MEKVLVLIEAIGKIKSLSKSLGAMGINADIIATKGHLFANPSHLFPVGINENFEETARLPVNDVLINRIKDTAGRYKHTIIATDPDQEGEVIASDIASLLPEQKLLRVYLAGLDTESIRRSFKAVTAFRKEKAWPGTCRRIVDRVIGATFTNQEQDVQVGRVQSALLGAIKAAPQSYGFARLSIQDSVGGQTFECLLPVHHQNHAHILNLIKQAEIAPLASKVIKSESLQDTPWNYAECIYHCAEKLETTIVNVDQAMQRLYERGELSYLRSNATGVSKNALACLESISQTQGSRRSFDSSKLPLMSQHDAHEAPRPMGDVNISLPIKLMDFDMAVLALITRQLIKCGTPGVREIPETSHLPAWAQSLPWERQVYPLLPWRESKPVYNQIIFNKIDASLMRVLNRYQLGRAGTQVDHALRFMRKKLHGVDLQLNQLGKHYVEHTQKEFLDPATSVQIEQMISMESDMPPAMRSAWIMAQMGDYVSGKTSMTVKQSGNRL